MSLLAGYYEAVDAEKRAQVGNLNANTVLTNANASVVGANAAANQQALRSQADSNAANSARTVAETQQVAPNAVAARSLQGAQTGLVGTQAAVLPGTAASETALRGFQGSSLSAATQLQQFQNQPVDPTQGYAKGGKVVSQSQADKGKGGKPGPSDTVQAALTPGEVVLNKGAVEHYGSDVISHMNRMGLMRMAAQSEVHQAAGLPDPHAGLPGFGASHGKPQQGTTAYGLQVVDDAAKAAPKSKGKAA